MTTPNEEQRAREIAEKIIPESVYGSILPKGAIVTIRYDIAQALPSYAAEVRAAEKEEAHFRQTGVRLSPAVGEKQGFWCRDCTAIEKSDCVHESVKDKDAEIARLREALEDIAETVHEENKAPGNLERFQIITFPVLAKIAREALTPEPEGKP